MTPPILRNAAMRRMPWRNGGGETVEVAAHPPGAAQDDFGWRISIATVAAPGPFSNFVGVDRSLAVLEGTGLVLEVSDAPAAVLRPGDPPHAFPGDRPTAARPLDGPAAVLNVMTRHGGWRHALSRRTGTLPTPSPGVHALLLAEAPLALEGPGGAVTLEARDALVLQGPVDVHAAAWLIELWPVGV